MKDVVPTIQVLAGTQLETSTPTLEVGKPTDAPSQLLPMRLPATIMDKPEDKFKLTGLHGDFPLSEM